MNRKQFLKNLLFGGIGIAVAPSLLAETKISSPNAGGVALGDGGVYGKPSNNPYIIKLKNINTETIYDIELFNANKNLGKNHFGLPCGVGFSCKANNNISSNIWTQYLELLYTTQSQPLNIPVVYLKSSQAGIGKNYLKFKVVKYNPATNKPNSMAYIWGYWSPYQFNDSEVLVKLADKNRICLDFRTAIIIPKLEPGAEIELHFYTQQMIDKMPVSNTFAKGFDEQFLEMA